MLEKRNYLTLLTFIAWNGIESHPRADLQPQFVNGIMGNVTVIENSQAVLPCVVENLGYYRVAWIRVESQTILTIHHHVITRNYRITLNHDNHQQWNLHISNVRESDRGQYMCQINTVPMMKMISSLNVLVPPKFMERGERVEQLAREGSNITLTCKVKGNPMPSVTWEREDGRPVGPPRKALDFGQELHILKVSRLHMGMHLCSASNSVFPPVTRGIMLQVLFPPMIWIPNQLIISSVGDSVSLDCYTEAFPMSINYWTKEDSCMIVPNEKYVITLLDNIYKVSMKLFISDIQRDDFGLYKCVARNSLGSTEGIIRIYEASKSISSQKIYHESRNDVQHEDAKPKHTFESGKEIKDNFNTARAQNSRKRPHAKKLHLQKKHTSDYLSSSNLSRRGQEPLEVVVLSLIVKTLTVYLTK